MERSAEKEGASWRVFRGLQKMTRRLPEGRWDPTKIPRIQILMSQDIFLVGVG